MQQSKELRRERTERVRGLILFFLYTARPRNIEAPTLLRLLDRRNYPMSKRTLAEHLQFLCEENLLRVETPSGGNCGTLAPCDLIERYANDDVDDQPDTVLTIRITNLGTNFQDGTKSIEGITRVE